MQNTYENVLNQLKTLDKKTEVYVPSHEGNILFTGLSVKDQKDIISAAISTESNNIEYNIALNDLITRKSAEVNILVTDRAPIAIALRAGSIGEIYKTGKQQVNLYELLATYQNANATIKYTDRVVEGDVSIMMRVPDLETDTKFLKASATKIKNIKNPGSVISELYVYELAKYVESIQYRSTSEGLSGEPVTSVSTARFNTLPVEDCVSLVELLPMKLNTKIVQFVTQTKVDEKIYTEYQGVQIPTDASLFALD